MPRRDGKNEDDQVFGSVYAGAYDLFYGEKNYDAECDLIEALWREYGDGGTASILDLGCGTGSHAIRLARRGHRVVPEVARAFIDRQLAAGKGLRQIKADIHAFERSILMEKVLIESELPKKDLIFLDRAVPDSIAYYRLESLDPHEARLESRRVRYRRVFLFERLEFLKDRVRCEDDRLAARLDELLSASYEELGYEILRVPVLTVAQRAEWVLARI